MGWFEDTFLGTDAKEGKRYSQISDDQRSALDSFMNQAGGYQSGAFGNLAGIGQGGYGSASQYQPANVWGQYGNQFNQLSPFSQSGYNAQPSFNVGSYSAEYKNVLNELMNKSEEGSPILGSAVRPNNINFNANIADPLGALNVENPFDEGGFRGAVQDGVINPLLKSSERNIADLQHKTGGSSFSLGSQRLEQEARSGLEDQLGGIGFQTEQEIMDRTMQGKMFQDQMMVDQNNQRRNALMQGEMAKLQANLTDVGQQRGIESDYANARNQFMLADFEAGLKRQDSVNNLSNTFLQKYTDFANIASSSNEGTQNRNFNAWNEEAGRDFGAYGVGADYNSQMNQIMSGIFSGDANRAQEYEQLQYQNQWQQWDAQMNSSMAMIQSILSGSTAGTYGMSAPTQGTSGLFADMLGGAGGLGMAFGAKALFA